MGQHWYDKDGNVHDTDLRTARKENLVPSVTTIISEFSNSYGLELYKARQMFFASLTLPRSEGISDEEYFQLVKTDSEQHSEDAKEFGSTLHFIIKLMLQGEDYYPQSDKQRFAVKKAREVVEWIKSNKESVIVDFKTQGTKYGKFNQPYDSWLFQLCAYHGYSMNKGEYIEHPFYYCGYGGTIDYRYLKDQIKSEEKLINIMISSTEDIPIKVYEWKTEKIEWGNEVWGAMLNLYRIMKKL